jgi:heterodisulfide reductase subunit A
MSERVGFYICHCGINIASKVRCAQVADFARTLPGVAISRDYLFMCADPGQELIERDVAEHGLTRVVVASCSPRMHENTFRAATARAGLNPYRAFHHVCVREHVSWVHLDEDEATAKAWALARAGIRRVQEQQRLVPGSFPVTPAALVVGGGIAGMEAALDIASAGHRVVLVDKEPTIGGHMLQYDKTFPTLDCAACIGTPKMVAVGQHKNIELLTHAEVAAVEGFVGNFKVTVHKKARYVDPSKCTGCGDCASVCPVDKPNAWDAGTRARKAIYRPFPQAVPITYLIDKSDRGPCVQTCPAGTNVQGYVALIKQGKLLEATQLIMERLPFPGTLGRVCPAPCEGLCRRSEVDAPVAIRALKRYAADHVDWEGLALPEIQRKDERQRVAVIGAGPAGLSAAYFLARWGYGVTVFEAQPVAGGMLRTGIPDYRLPPAVLDREIRYIERLGVELRLGSPVGQGLTVEDLFARGFLAVLAAVGAHREARLGVEGEDQPGVVPGIGFLRQVNLTGVAPIGQNVVVIGGGAVAMDVARTARRLGACQVRVVCLEGRSEMPAWKDEVRGALDEGIEILNGWGPSRFLSRGGRVCGLRLKRCTRVFDDAGRFAPMFDEGCTDELACDTAIVAIGQGPDRAWLEGAGGVPVDARGYVQADPETFATSRPGLFAAGELTTGPSIVVRAVANGRAAALSIDRYLRGELPVAAGQRTASATWNPIPPHVQRTPRALMAERAPDKRLDFSEVELGLSPEQARREAQRCIACGTCSECMLCVSQCKAGAIAHHQRDEQLERSVGAIIVATGFDVMDPTPLVHYGYGKYPGVLTNLEFERLCNATGPTSGKILLRDPAVPYGYNDAPRSVAILHCMGSRDRNYHAYCSRTCCMYALKYAHLLKDRVGHHVEVYNFYIDMRCFGKGYEEFYERTQAEGVRMIRGKASRVVMPTDDEGELGALVVVAEDTLTQRLLRVPVDMVVLCTAMEARKDARDVARRFGIATGNDGFFLEEHPKLAPVSTATAGVFVAGACQGPKDIPDSVAQAKAAASMAQALITRGQVEVSPVASRIDPDLCAGCRACAALCPYGSIDFDERRHISVVNDAVCKGCGSCAAHCPSGAAKVSHFTDEQMFRELEGLLAAEAC